MLKIVISIFLILIIVSTSYASIIFIEYSATPLGDRIIIDWIVKSENEVNKYIVIRSNDNKKFKEIGVVSSEKDSSIYKYVDKYLVFNGNHAVYYKIKALRIDMSIVAETESLIVTPNFSGIYHTWAAIKAMFR